MGALWVLECAFASPWPAARCESAALGPELASRSELTLKLSQIKGFALKSRVFAFLGANTTDVDAKPFGLDT